MGARGSMQRGHLDWGLPIRHRHPRSHLEPNHLRRSASPLEGWVQGFEAKGISTGMLTFSCQLV